MLYLLGPYAAMNMESGDMEVDYINIKISKMMKNFDKNN